MAQYCTGFKTKAVPSKILGTRNPESQNLELGEFVFLFPTLRKTRETWGTPLWI
jgi:hypothetical protein